MRQQVRFLPGAPPSSSQPISSSAGAHASPSHHPPKRLGYGLQSALACAIVQRAGSGFRYSAGSGKGGFADMAKLRAVETAPASALRTLVDDYLAHCRARGLAPNTVNQAYRYPLLGVLLPFCERERIADVSAINAPVLDRLSAELLESGGRNGQPLSPHSVHSYSRAINHFLSWAKKEGEQVDARAQLPKLPKRLVEVLSREEVQQMEHAARTERDKLIIRILADTGLRVGELLGLRTNDLVEQNRNYYLHVRGEGAKDRLVPAPRVYRRL